MRKIWKFVVGSVPPASQDQITLFKKMIGNSCKECHDTFNAGAINAFSVHLEIKHGVDELTACKITDELVSLRGKFRIS